MLSFIYVCVTILEEIKDKDYNNNDFEQDLMSKPIIPPPGERFKLFFNEDTEFNFGNHCYIETAQNKESYLTISDVKFQLNDSIKSAYHKVQKVISSYGKRAEAAASDNGVDWKAISHCVRVLLQVEELLTINKITFPLKEADFVKSIKYVTTNWTYDEIMSWIEDHIMYIDEVLLPKSTGFRLVQKFKALKFDEDLHKRKMKDRMLLDDIVMGVHI